MKVLSVVGSSNSGKTELITKVVPLLMKKGLKVLVVKHARFFEMDREGKDSWKIFRCGVDVVVSSKDKTAYISRIRDDLEIICDLFGRNYDLIITEGFNRACKDRIVLLKDPDELDRFKCGKILAIVSDFEIKGYRCFKRDDYDGIVRVILEWYHKR